MNSLEFIKKHVGKWPDDILTGVHLSDDCQAVFSNNSSLPPIVHRIQLNGNTCTDTTYWTREEFEACDISGMVSTVNRDIERGTIDAVISQRGSRYGKFKDGADIMQELKMIMRSKNGWHNLSASQKEALEMIQHKIGRVLNGDPNYIDNWIDICGYSKLVSDELNGDSK